MPSSNASSASDTHNDPFSFYENEQEIQTLENFFPQFSSQVSYPPEVLYNFERPQKIAENDGIFDIEVISQLSDSEIFQRVADHGFPIRSGFLRYLLCQHKFSLLERILSELGWGFNWPQDIQKDSWTRFPFDLAFDPIINPWIKDHLYLFVSPCTHFFHKIKIEDLWGVVVDENYTSFRAQNGKVQVINEYHLEYLNTINFPNQYVQLFS
jgi:hypothetical protein